MRRGEEREKMMWRELTQRGKHCPFNQGKHAQVLVITKQNRPINHKNCKNLSSYESQNYIYE